MDNTFISQNVSSLKIQSNSSQAKTPQKNNRYQQTPNHCSLVVLNLANLHLPESVLMAHVQFDRATRTRSRHFLSSASRASRAALAFQYFFQPGGCSLCSEKDLCSQAACIGGRKKTRIKQKHLYPMVFIRPIVLLLFFLFVIIKQTSNELIKTQVPLKSSFSSPLLAFLCCLPHNKYGTPPPAPQTINILWGPNDLLTG